MGEIRAAMASGGAAVVAPRPLLELTTERVLVMEYLPGDKLLTNVQRGLQRSLGAAGYSWARANAMGVTPPFGSASAEVLTPAARGTYEPPIPLNSSRRPPRLATEARLHTLSGSTRAAPLGRRNPLAGSSLRPPRRYGGCAAGRAARYGPPSPRLLRA